MLPLPTGSTLFPYTTLFRSNKLFEERAQQIGPLQDFDYWKAGAKGPNASTDRVQQQSRGAGVLGRSEEHTSELQSLAYLVCRLLLEKKKESHPAGHENAEII